MQQITINEFEDTTTINIPKDVAYVSIEGYSGAPIYHYEEITDSCTYNVIENHNFNTIVLDRNNFTTDQFPLIITTFSDSDISGGTPLFGRPLGVPFNSARIATGKRHNPCKNITLDDFSNYVNEGGSSYVTKSFEGLDPDIARENLNVYSKEEIDRIAQEYEYTNVNFNKTKNDALRFGDTNNNYPFIQTTQLIPGRTNSHNTLHSYFKSGVCGFEITFRNVKTYADMQLNPWFFSDIQGIFNGRQFTTQTPLIIKPVVKNFNGDRPGYFRRGYVYGNAGMLTDPVPNIEGQYPVMIITPDYQIKFNNYTLDANSVYFIDLEWYYIKNPTPLTPSGISWYDSTDFDDAKYNFSYICSFAPNDPQLN